MNRRGIGAGGARVPVFPLGDSLTRGFSGALGANNAGGWRVQLRSPVVTVGPYTDFGKHGGVNGDQLAEMNTRFAADYQVARAITVLGGANDVNDGLTATHAATALGTLLDTIIATAPGVPIYVLTCPYLNFTVGAKNAVLAEANRRFDQVVAAKRAAGSKVYYLDVGGLIEDNSHLDGVDSGGLQHPINGVYGAVGTGTGYGLMAYGLDRYLIGSVAADPTMGGLTLEESYRASSVSGSTLTNLAASGSARDITLFNSPTAGTGVNGAAKLTFNGTTQYGRSGSGWTIAQPSTIAWVGRPTSATGGPALCDGATVTARQVLMCNTSSQIQAFAGTMVTDALINPLTVVHCYVMVFNGASSELYVDGVPRRVAVNPGAQGGNGFTLCASAAASPTNFMAGDWYALDRFSGAATDAGVHAYMQHINQTFGFWPRIGQVTSW